MHVCFIYHHEYPADFSTAINGYTRALEALDHEVTVIAGRSDPKQPAQETIGSIHVHRITTDLSTSVSVEPTRFGYRALKVLHEVHQSNPVDVLQLRSFPNLGGILHPVPWLNSPSCVVSDVRGTAVSNRYFEFLSRVGIRAQDSLVDRTLVIDEHVADQIFGGTEKVDVLPLGVDFEAFNPGENTGLRTQWGFNDSVVIGYVGHLHQSRELSTMIEALAQAQKEVPELALVIVGDGEAYPRLQRQAKKLNQSDRVYFTGSVPFENVPDYMHAFDIGAGYVADKPQYRNQPPLKTVEYLASGLPVVATDTPGNRRFVNSTNAIITPDSANQFAEGLAKLGKNPSLRETLSSNARQSVREYNYEQIVADKLLPVYRKLLAAD